MGRLLLLFIAVPAAELALLIEIGSRIGTPATIALIVVTGVLGANLARQQGLAVLRELQGRLEGGELPASTLVDGLMVLMAAALLVTPGVLTDAVGFLCLTPGFRSWLKRRLQARFERAIAEKKIHVSGWDATPSSPRSEPLDITDRGHDERTRHTDRDADEPTLH